ncbi:hypothetical protein AOQ84DRAFT_414160 [Glonium stellatum]|uniref:Uncharacterized protein n=1 Tax=Glonium stellatum TaxID=574774 RepID=A0A8E2EUP1_9PEZI|nr:hypothetical protein AOQ84DRAFT_414160 [Glonium stellatum]
MAWYGHRFRAAASTNPTFLFRDSSNILQVDGCIFDTVLHRSEKQLKTDFIPKQSNPRKRGSDCIGELYDEAAMWQSPLHSVKSANDLKRTLAPILAVDGWMSLRYSKLNPAQRARLLFAEFVEYWPQNCATDNERANGILDSEIDSLRVNSEELPTPLVTRDERAVVYGLRNRKLFYTKKGFFGLGPAVM